MKRIIIPLCCIGVLIYLFINFEKISKIILDKIISKNHTVVPNGNEYEKKYSFNFVQNTDTFTPYSRQDLINIVYTALNKGIEEFTFYCPNEYQKCVSDIENISNDENLFAELNNFVHPYNSFTNIKTTYSNSGEIVINIYHLYTIEQISQINRKVNEIIKLINHDDTDYNKIKTIHDYIINNTKYDVERNKTGSSNYSSQIAYGPAFEGFATCNGYTDLMAIILSKMGYKNFKISTSLFELSKDETGHIWNAVYIDGKWLHLDLTWDDPVSTDNSDYLYHTYFLISTSELEAADSGQVATKDHKFNHSIYTELKNWFTKNQFYFTNQHVGIGLVLCLNAESIGSLIIW